MTVTAKAVDTPEITPLQPSTEERKIISIHIHGTVMLFSRVAITQEYIAMPNAKTIDMRYSS